MSMHIQVEDIAEMERPTVYNMSQFYHSLIG